jgi:hypothetical protein
VSGDDLAVSDEARDVVDTGCRHPADAPPAGVADQRRGDFVVVEQDLDLRTQVLHRLDPLRVVTPHRVMAANRADVVERSFDGTPLDFGVPELRGLIEASMGERLEVLAHDVGRGLRRHIPILAQFARRSGLRAVVACCAERDHAAGEHAARKDQEAGVSRLPPAVQHEKSHRPADERGAGQQERGYHSH